MWNPQIGLLIFLLLASAFFSATEATFFSLNRVQLRRMERDGRRSSRRVLKALSRPSDLLITVLIGSNLANIGLSVLATGLFLSLLGPKGLEVSIVVTTATVLLIGEVTPKTLAVNFPEVLSRRLVLPYMGARILLRPVVVAVTWISHACLRLLGLEARTADQSRVLSRGELGLLLEGADAEGIMTAQEARLVQNILQFSNTRAEEIMTPRVDMVAAPLTMERPDLEALAVRAKHSRIPIYRQTIDEVVGYIATREFLLQPERKLAELLRPLTIYPGRALISQVFYETQRQRTPVVIVVNEYGETVGLLTREDLLEELVGEIYDEFELREEPLQRLEPGLFVARGTLNLEELNEALGLDLPVDEALTLNGLLSGLHGGIPPRGERIFYDGIEFTVTEVSRHRIQRCTIRLHGPARTASVEGALLPPEKGPPVDRPRARSSASEPEDPDASGSGISEAGGRAKDQLSSGRREDESEGERWT